MNIDECKPGVRVIAPSGEGVLLHPDPRKPERWLVYRDGRGEWHEVGELRRKESDATVRVS